MVMAFKEGSRMTKDQSKEFLNQEFKDFLVWVSLEDGRTRSGLMLSLEDFAKDRYRRYHDADFEG